MKRGFSLIEMSVVIAVIGLIIGGILGGRALLAGQELRRIGADAKMVEASIKTFQDKYGGLPGDIKNALKYWATAVNGNGDGYVGVSAGAADYTESMQIWLQLGKSGMIDGTYSGARTSINGLLWLVPGTNVIGTARTGLFWFGQPDQNMSTHMYNSEYLVAAGTGPFFNALFIGRVANSGTNNDWPSGGLLRPEDAKALDDKLDDGKASSGKFMAKNAAGAALNDCVDAAAGATVYGGANYVLSSKEEGCFMMITYDK